MDVWELNPELGLLWLKASATLGVDHWLKATMIRCRWAVPLFIYTSASALQLRKSTGNLSQGKGGVIGKRKKGINIGLECKRAVESTSQ
jgi:hypothetical protein